MASSRGNQKFRYSSIKWLIPGEALSNIARRLSRFRKSKRSSMTSPGLRILMPDEVPEDQSNNITLSEVVQPERAMEFMVTVLIDGTAIAVSGPFASIEEAVDQANDLSKHYQLEPIYVRREQA